MKNTLKLIAALLISTSVNPAFSQENTWAPTIIGAHLVTAHTEAGFNNTNPGVYARWADASGTGPVAGTYHNSERAQSAYAGYSWSWRTSGSGGQPNTGALSASITAGLITGYRAAKVLPLLVPSAAWHTSQHTALRLTYVPKIEKRGAHALHLSAEWSF
jgi:hypothetical protein